MFFELNDIYHVYNKGNNSQTLFFTKENYIFFLKKIENELKPFCDILAYCLMPNHYHLMIQANENSVQVDNSKMQKLARRIGVLQSSYTQAINKEKGTSGSLFKQKAKVKSLSQIFLGARKYQDYTLNCFLYIHQNPLNAGLVSRFEDWEFSSYNEYCSIKDNSICNTSLAYTLLGIEQCDLSSILERETHYEL